MEDKKPPYDVEPAEHWYWISVSAEAWERTRALIFTDGWHVAFAGFAIVIVGIAVVYVRSGPQEGFVSMQTLINGLIAGGIVWAALWVLYMLRIPAERAAKLRVTLGNSVPEDEYHRVVAERDKLRGTPRPRLIIRFVKKRHTQVGEDRQILYRVGVGTNDGSPATGVRVELAGIRCVSGGTPELSHQLRTMRDCPLARKHDRQHEGEHDLPSHETDFDLIYEPVEPKAGTMVWEAGSVPSISQGGRTPNFWALYFGIEWPPAPLIPHGEYELTVRASSAGAETATATFRVRPSKARRLIVNRAG